MGPAGTLSCLGSVSLISETTYKTILNLQTTVSVLVTEAERPLIPARGMLTVATQVYRPPSDDLRGENLCSRELEPATSFSVELGNTNFISGRTTRPWAILAEHCRE